MLFIHSRKTPKKVIDAEELKRLASLGKSRAEIAKAFKRPYSGFWNSVNDSLTLSEAYADGVRMFKESADKQE